MENEQPEKKKGRPRKYDYKGKKKVTSIRLTYNEKRMLVKKFGSVQAFVQFCIDNL